MTYPKEKKISFSKFVDFKLIQKCLMKIIIYDRKQKMAKKKMVLTKFR